MGKAIQKEEMRACEKRKAFNATNTPAQIKQREVVISHPSSASKTGEGWRKGFSSLLLCGRVQRHNVFTEPFLISNHKNVHSLRPGHCPSKSVSSGIKLMGIWGSEPKNHAWHPAVLRTAAPPGLGCREASVPQLPRGSS